MPQKIPKWLVPAVGYLISAVSLVWVFAHFPFGELARHLEHLDWTWVAIAVTVEIGVYFIDAWRWKALLRPAGAPAFSCCAQAVFVGIFANDILPARTGEVIRCFLLSYKTDVHLPVAISSDLIVRIMDGLWLVILYLLVTFQVASHTGINRVMWIFGMGSVAAALIAVWILFHRQHAHHFVNSRGWAAKFVHIFEEIHELGRWQDVRRSMAITGLYWLAQVVALWAIARADSFDFSLAEMGFLLVVRSMWTLIPNAPANMGPYQAAIVYALGLLLTEKPQAQILAQIMFSFMTLPPLIGGAIAVALAGFNITELHHHAHHAHSSRMKRRTHEANPAAGPDLPPR